MKGISVFLCFGTLTFVVSHVYGIVFPVLSKNFKLIKKTPVFGLSYKKSFGTYPAGFKHHRFYGSPYFGAGFEPHWLGKIGALGYAPLAKYGLEAAKAKLGLLALNQYGLKKFSALPGFESFAAFPGLKNYAAFTGLKNFAAFPGLKNYAALTGLKNYATFGGFHGGFKPYFNHYGFGSGLHFANDFWPKYSYFLG